MTDRMSDDELLRECNRLSQRTSGNEAKGRFTDTGFVAGATPETPPAKAVQPPGTLPLLGGHAGSNRAAIEVASGVIEHLIEMDDANHPGAGHDYDYIAQEVMDAIGRVIPNSASEHPWASLPPEKFEAFARAFVSALQARLDATPNSVAEQIVAARDAIRAIAKSDGVDADSFSMATAAYEALHGRKLTSEEVEQALDLAFKPEQWS